MVGLQLLLNTTRKPNPRNSIGSFQHPSVTPNLGSRLLLLHFTVLLQWLFRLLCHTTGVVNPVQLLQLVDNTGCWTLFTTFDQLTVTVVTEVHFAMLLQPHVFWVFLRIAV